jgi:hypothetical protein
MLPPTSTVPLNTNALYALYADAAVEFVVFARMPTLSPTFSNVTVVVPMMKSNQVIPLSVVYSKDIDGAEPTFYIATVELASLAMNVSPPYIQSV